MIPVLGEVALKGLLDSFKARLQARLSGRLSRMVLFGSYARGTVGKESDIDVLILVHPMLREDFDVVCEEAANLMIQHKVVIEPLCLDTTQYQRMIDEERALALDVEREGVPV